MNDYNNSVTYKFSKVLNDNDISDLQSKLQSVEGIDSFDVTAKSIRIDYVTLQLTKDVIKESIRNMGYPLNEISRERKGILRRFIDNLARSNEEAFGRKKLDCCDLKH